MGVYLSQPITDKVSEDSRSGWLKCGVSSMQGWRSSQEDAHNCVLGFDDETSLFAVYDGHGGHEVAEYTARYLPDFIKSTEAYKKGLLEQGLVDAFLDFDATLTDKAVFAKLKQIAMEKRDGHSPDKEEDEVDVAELKEEANMPLTELIAKYASGGAKNNPAVRRLSSTSTAASAQSDLPASPYLKAKPDKKDGGGAGCSKDGGDAPAVNGVPETNGEAQAQDSAPTADSVPAATNKEEAGSGEGGVNGEEEGAVGGAAGGGADEEEGGRSVSTIRNAKKKATVTMLAQLFEDNPSDTDSDNDESFHAKDSSMNDDDEEEEEEDGEGDDEEAGEGEEEEGEGEDDDEEEEEDSDEYDSFHLQEYGSSGLESGCAAVVALVHKRKVYVANAGDSRAVLCRDGKALDLSIDHKPDDPLERDRIHRAGGTVTHDGRVNGGLNLSRALGDHYYKKNGEMDAKSQMIIALPDIQTADIDPSKDEFLVLACDGIWNSMTSQEVVDFVRPLVKQGHKLSSICEELFDKCMAPDTMGDGTGCDNMTCIVVTFSEDGAPASSGSPDSVKRSASPLPEQDSNKRPKVNSPTPDAAAT